MPNVKNVQIPNASIQCTSIQCKIFQITTIKVQVSNERYVKSQLFQIL